MIYMHLCYGGLLVEQVFNILRACGLDMYERNGLEHWIPDYPKEAIENDCRDKFVVLGYDDERKQYISTFQMYLDENRNLYIRKVATLPAYQGKGIGKKNLNYNQRFCKETWM